jgi:hypothetical protein
MLLDILNYCTEAEGYTKIVGVCGGSCVPACKVFRILSAFQFRGSDFLHK